MEDIVRDAVLAADPGITETVKWNAPNFVFDGADRVTLRLPPRGRLQVILHRGAKVRDDVETFEFDEPSGRLVWPARDRGILTLEDEADAAASASFITDLVQRWIVA
jgi:hypothetical protein